jgi:hypothetical protein
MDWREGLPRWVLSKQGRNQGACHSGTDCVRLPLVNLLSKGVFGSLRFKKGLMRAHAAEDSRRLSRSPFRPQDSSPPRRGKSIGEFTSGSSALNEVRLSS